MQRLRERARGEGARRKGEGGEDRAPKRHRRWTSKGPTCSRFMAPDRLANSLAGSHPAQSASEPRAKGPPHLALRTPEFSNIAARRFAAWIVGRLVSFVNYKRDRFESSSVRYFASKHRAITAQKRDKKIGTDQRNPKIRSKERAKE